MNYRTYFKSFKYHVMEKMFILSEEHKNFCLRTCIVVLLLFVLHIIIIIGPVGFIIGAILVQTICYAELLIIFVKSQNNFHNKFYLLLAIYFYIVVNYFLFSSLLFNRHACTRNSCNLMFNIHSTNHILISYLLYLAGFLLFIIKMPVDNLKITINLYSWLHTCFLLVSIPIYLAIQNMLYGLFWLVLPIILVGANDLLAYIFGKTIGKTALIKLSPKKTWEGFIGAAVTTVLLGHVLATYITDLEYFLCPVDFTMTADIKCNYHKEEDLSSSTVVKQNYYVHTMIMSLFASIIAPFGGFFASGFKRAYGVKNFSNILPGHGGLLDRFDCQFLMAVFVNVYIRTFVRIEKEENALNALQKVNTI